jgi:hypothetical protein
VRRAEGYELDEATAALVPDTAIGRLLDQEEAAKLIRRIERGSCGGPRSVGIRELFQNVIESPSDRLAVLSKQLCLFDEDRVRVARMNCAHPLQKDENQGRPTGHHAAGYRR